LWFSQLCNGAYKALHEGDGNEPTEDEEEEVWQEVQGDAHEGAKAQDGEGLDRGRGCQPAHEPDGQHHVKLVTQPGVCLYHGPNTSEQASPPACHPALSRDERKGDV